MITEIDLDIQNPDSCKGKPWNLISSTNLFETLYPRLIFIILLLFTSIIITRKTKKYLVQSFKVIATSKLNSGIVFSLATFWGLRADEMGTKDQGAEGQGPRKRNKGRGSRDTNTLPKVLLMIHFFSR